MAIDLVTRAEWNARTPRGAYSPLTSTLGVKVHYTGGRVEPATLHDHAKCVKAVRAIQNMHMDSNGWLDIGYSMICCAHRKVFVGRGPHHLPAANGAGLNSNHYAVLGLVGNSGLVEPPDDMLHGILDAVAYLREHGRAGGQIKGHRDGYSTDCPGEPLYAWVRKGAPRPGGPVATPVDPAETPWPGRALKYVKGKPMMKGDDVEAWQKILVANGIKVDVDGFYGKVTTAATEKFQELYDIIQDGVVGPESWRTGQAAMKAGNKK
ncbi:peptidoglycan recognition protein family protein [Sphaerisporangium sp. NPDC004334]